MTTPDALKRMLLSLTLLIGLAGAALAKTPATQPATDTAVITAKSSTDGSADDPAKASLAEQARHLRDGALQDALDGKFDQALDALQRARKINPGDKLAGQAAALLSDYQKHLAQTNAQRRREYDYEVDRIRWAYQAQDYIETHDGDSQITQLRKLITETLTDTYQALGTPEIFEEASADEAREMKATTLAKIGEARGLIDQALEVLAGQDSPYARTFQKLARTLRKRLDQAQTLWQAVDPTSLRSRWQGARKIDTIQDDLADAMTDLEVMVAENPWKVALLHARLARDITPDADALRQADWYKQLKQDIERRGREAIDDAEWYDALTAYAGLEELEKDNPTYRDQLKRVSGHVRVLRLYGKENEDKTDETASEEHEPVEQAEGNTWEDLVQGVDAQMVRTAIKKLGTSYVTAVDYRQLTRGALHSIKVLAETPQVRETFPGLDDEEQRKAFLKVLDNELADIQAKDRVDHVRLLMAMNKVLYTSEETVNIPLEVLVVEFADGFLNELDKFSSMIWPHDVADFNKSTMGQFTGIGVQITKEQGEPLKVVTPLLGTPAYKAGIKAGDLITEVDGLGTRTRTIDALIKRIMGPPGTKVVLTIKRRGLAEPLKIPVIREAVRIRTVKGWQRHENGEWDYLLDPENKIGYIRLTQFTGTTHRQLHKALAELKDKSVRSVVLDLRANPGGLLRSATAAANEFLNSGRIVYTRGRQVPRNEINATREGSFLDGDLVVLVDQHSASAAEILSGALKDWNRSLIVGKRSYGKGSVQNVIPVKNDDAFLKLTTAYYYLPSGRLLHRKDDANTWGVDPDVEVYITPKQMRRWLEIRRKNDLLQEFDPELLAADLKRQFAADIQLETAVLMLKLQKLREQARQQNYFASENPPAQGP